MDISNEEWWRDKNTYIGQIENEETHVTNVHAKRNIEGEWEYVIIKWRHLIPHLKYIFKEGKILDKNGKDYII